MNNAQGLIDVHAHYVLPGDTEGDGARKGAYEAWHFVHPPFTTWSVQQATEFMDAHGIAVQMLSASTATTVDYARRLNDFGAQVVADNPDRFGLLATLPLNDPQAAVTEMDRAWTELGADGFVLVSNYDGKYLGDQDFADVFAHLNRLGATAFLHPVHPPGFDAVSCDRPGPVFEFPVETARTVIDAMYAGVFRRYPDFKLILAHAGGVLPTLGSRLASIGTLSWVPNPNALSASDVTDCLRKLHYDTALAASDNSLAPLGAVTPTSNLVYGSDFPPAGVSTIEDNLAALRNGSLVDTDDFDALRENTLRLFPRLRARLSPTPAAEEIPHQ